jgi:AcrR family transcriptional regulator
VSRRAAEPMTAAAGAVPTQQRITDAALTLFAERGFTATGIRDIADAAGLSTAALYHYMGTKEDLLLHIMTEGLRRFASASRQAVADLAGPPRHIVALTRVHVATEVLQRRMSLVIDQEVRSLSTPEPVLALRDDYESLWAHAISLGVQTGEFRIADPALGRLALLEMCNGVAHWFSANGRLTLGQVCDAFSEMALALLSATTSGGSSPTTVAALEMSAPQREMGFVIAAYAAFCPPDFQGAT